MGRDFRSYCATIAPNPPTAKEGLVLANANITVRRASPEDAPSIIRFQMSMALETEGRALDETTLAAGVRAVFDSPAGGFYLVAEIGGDIAGSLMITYEWSDWRNAPIWWIQSVFVDAGHRRRGVYTAMHKRAIAMATESGAGGVRLYVERTNHIAQATYASLGMSQSHYDLYEVEFD